MSGMSEKPKYYRRTYEPVVQTIPSPPEGVSKFLDEIVWLQHQLMASMAIPAHLIDPTETRTNMAMVKYQRRKRSEEVVEILRNVLNDVLGDK